MVAPCLSLFSPLFAMRRPGVRIPSRPPSFKRPPACRTVLPQHPRTRCYVQDGAGNGLEPVIHLINGIRVLLVRSLPDSFRYLVIHPERHCLSAASSVNTSRLCRYRSPCCNLDYFRVADNPEVIAWWF